MLSALITSEVHTGRNYYKRIFGICGLEKLGFSRRCISVDLSIVLFRRGHFNHSYLKISCLSDLNNMNLFVDICTEYNLVVWWVFEGVRFATD